MKRSGIIGGTGTVLLANIHSTEILKTVVLATTGAVVSTLVTAFVRKWIVGRK